MVSAGRLVITAQKRILTSLGASGLSHTSTMWAYSTSIWPALLLESRPRWIKSVKPLKRQASSSFWAISREMVIVCILRNLSLILLVRLCYTAGKLSQPARSAQFGERAREKRLLSTLQTVPLAGLALLTAGNISSPCCVITSTARASISTSLVGPQFFARSENIPILYTTTGEGDRLACQFMAMEGACFVVVSTQVMSDKGREKLKLVGSPHVQTPGGGFAMIFGPDGTPLVDPMDPGEEGILTAEIQLNTTDYAKQMLDVVGHYSRPDLLSLKVNLKTAKAVHYE